MALAEKIKELRGWKPKTVLAREVGVSRVSVDAWEKGTAQPSSKRLPALARALKTTVDYLLSDEPTEQPQP